MNRIVACAAALSLAACATLPRTSGSCDSIRAMSWNIAAGHGNLARIAEVIRSWNPDIVGLQEVDVHWSDRSAFVDQADSLARSLGMNVRFAPIYSIRDTVSGKPPKEFGVVLLSRYPIASFTNHSITRLSTQQPNAKPSPAPGFLEAEIQAPGGLIAVYDTHLDYRADPSVRATQAKEMVEIMNRTATRKLLFGDLNASRGAPELAPLAFLKDGLAACDSCGLSYPAEKPVKRIDFVLASSDFDIVEIRTDTTTASDHRPVVATLRPMSCAK